MHVQLFDIEPVSGIKPQAIFNEAGSDLDLIQNEVGMSAQKLFKSLIWVLLGFYEITFIIYDLMSCGVNKGKKRAYHRDQNIGS